MPDFSGNAKLPCCNQLINCLLTGPNSALFTPTEWGTFCLSKEGSTGAMEVQEGLTARKGASQSPTHPATWKWASLICVVSQFPPAQERARGTSVPWCHYWKHNLWQVALVEIVPLLTTGLTRCNALTLSGLSMVVSGNDARKTLLLLRVFEGSVRYNTYPFYRSVSETSWGVEGEEMKISEHRTR